MKIINKTPFYNEKGEISVVDRAKAMLQFGKSWVDEVEAQNAILPLFEKSLGAHFVLLRNVELPEVGIVLPFLLVGPPGVFMIYVTAIKGTYRAKGDEWGIISGGAFKPLKPNLLTRVDQMGRAVQRYLERKGHPEVAPVESVLLCADPAVHVDSQRPIVRIVMRDAVERFLTTLSQAPSVLDRKSIQEIVELITNPPVEAEPPAAVEADQEAFSKVQEADLEEGTDIYPRGPETELAASVVRPASAQDIQARAEMPTVPPFAVRPRRKRPVLTTKQWLFLGAMFLFWCLLIGAFLFLIVQDMTMMR
ncbi:MAG: hypothetical protein N2049_07675 [Anaerolineales bacterium]|nr:hypothetical protein [Anaerolineales bacterium]MDW8226832.1 hypothetical protein [Anaerolineales bacterium]